MSLIFTSAARISGSPSDHSDISDLAKRKKRNIKKKVFIVTYKAYLYLLHKKYFGVKNRYVLNNEKTRKKSVTIFFRVRLKYSMNYSH